MTSHVMKHVGVMAAIFAVLLVVGVPAGTALTMGLVAGCALMMFMMMGGMSDGHRRDRDDAPDRG